MRGTIAIGLLLAVIPLTARADVRDDVLNGAERCAGITDNRVWLDCFYGSAQPMRALLGLAPAPQAHLVPPPGAAYLPPAGAARRQAYAPPPKDKGFFGDILGSTKSKLTQTPMAKYSYGRDGRFTVTLPDGQQWRQTESDIARAQWKGPADTYVVIIETATQGHYSLKVKGQSGLYTVDRLDG